MVASLREGRVICFILLMLLLPMTVSAEIRSSVRLDLGNSLGINPDPNALDARYGVGGTGKLTFESTANRDVKGQLSLLATVSPEIQSITLDRAYIITRFDILRLTIGKTRVSWGEGRVFNAADLVMGASDLAVNLTGGEVRSQTVWMTTLKLSLDRFAFLEAVVLPPLPNLQGVALGARFLTEFDGLALKLEGGYFYRGNEARHQAYFSLHGGEGLNWHLSSSLGMDEESVSGTVEDFFGGLQASAGLYFLENIGQEGEDLGFGMRAELLFDYGRGFSEQNPGNPDLSLWPLRPS